MATMLGNTLQRWGSVQIWLHWTIAGLLCIQVPVAFGMVGESRGPVQDALFNLHKNIGLIIFGLAIVRLGWRVSHPVPYLPADLPRWQATTAHATHWLLYILLFAMPITGFLYTALSGFPVPLLMLVDIAKLIPVNKPEGEEFKFLHLSLQWLLYLVVAVHIMAAFHHHLSRKDWVLRRMMSPTEPLEGSTPASAREESSGRAS